MTGHEYIRQVRLAQGKTLRAVSEKAGISHNYVKRIEDGKSVPDFMITLRLLNALGIKTRDFLAVIGYKEPVKKCRWRESNPHEVALNGF